jgi:hypothetical protein
MPSAYALAGLYANMVGMDEQTLRALARRNRQDKAREKSSYATLIDAMWRAQDEGWKQKDIVRAVELTRERVRQICHPAYRKSRTPPGGPGRA